MNKLFYILLSVLFLKLLSCGNIPQKIEAEKEENLVGEIIKIEYLEDFEQFVNHEQMAEYFGEEKVQDTVFLKGINRYMNVSILNPEYTNRVVVYWGEDDDTFGAEFIETTYYMYTYDGKEAIEGGDIYPTKSGVKIGTSNVELHEINGQKITFLAMGGDFAGGVHNLSEKLGNYNIYLGCPECEKLDEWPEEYDYLFRDGGIKGEFNEEFSSDDEKAMSIHTEVVLLRYSIPWEDRKEK